MIANCPGCQLAATDVREPSRARARLPWLAVLPPALYALAPKCPLCLVAYLSALGVTFGMASVALSVLRALAIASVVLALGFAFRRAKVPSFLLSWVVGLYQTDAGNHFRKKPSSRILATGGLWRRSNSN
jgi:hypothetical protein